MQLQSAVATAARQLCEANETRIAAVNERRAIKASAARALLVAADAREAASKAAALLDAVTNRCTKLLRVVR